VCKNGGSKSFYQKRYLLKFEVLLTNRNNELTETLMNDLNGKEDTSEPMAVIKIKDNANHVNELPDNPMIAWFDRLSNNGNLGTLLRSCDAFGINKLIITGYAVDI